MTILVLLSSCGGGSSAAAVTSATSQSSSNNASNIANAQTLSPVVIEVVPNPEQFSGVAQKGPFGVNSKITIDKLDSFGVAIGDSVESKVDNKSGRFLYEAPSSWNLSEESAYLQIHAQGFVLDEFTGLESTDALELISITDHPDSSSVNVLTSWKAQRAKVLIGEGKNLENALRQSEGELNALFGIKQFNRLDITDNTSSLSPDNTLLILLSGVLMEVANKEGVKVQQIINQIGEDFSKEGAIDLVGNDWLKRFQATLRDNPAHHLNTYARNINRSLGRSAVTGENLPGLITFASRPSAILPTEIFAEPGETIVLDGSESHDNEEGALVNFTWFRVDQQTEFNVPLSDRFAVSPSITVPNVPSILLFALVVTDQNDLTDTTVIRVIVRVPPPTNTPPTAEDQQVFTEEDTPIEINLVANDDDGDSLSFNIATPQLLLNGILEGTPPNLIYRPDQNSNNGDSFTFSVSDDSETSSPARVDIFVSPVNDQPTAFDQFLNTLEDQPISNIALTGFDVDGDSLNFDVLVDPLHGTLAGSSPNITYSPDTGYNGPDTFEFIASDGLRNSSLAVVSITVVPVNDNPIADDDSYTTDEDSSVILIPLANDTDPDGDNLVVSSINGVVLTGGVQAITVNNGIVNIDAVGEISFAATSNFSGESTFDYQVSDGNGGTDTATETVTINPVNDDPTAVDDSYDTDEEVAVTLTPLANDTDPENDSLSITSINGSAIVGGTQSINVNDGTVDISSAGVISFTPATGFAGQVSFAYAIADGNSGAATANQIITVSSVNDAPVADNDSVTTDEDVSVTLTPLTNDTDPDGDTVVISSINGVALTGNAQTIPVNHGDVLINASGVIKFTPDDNFSGNVSFGYEIDDGNGASDTATISITVDPINDDPAAVDNSYDTDEDVSVTLTPLANDTDPENDSLSITSINGSALLGGTQSINVNDGTVDISSAGVISFTPATDFVGQVSFAYVIADGNGGTATANQIITVSSVNDAPVADNDSVTTDEDVSVTLTPLTNDTDPDGDTVVISAINGVALTGNAQTIPVNHGDVLINASGVIKFTPDDNFSGNVSFGYEIDDGNGASDSATISIAVTPINDDPIAVDDNYNVLEDGFVILTPLTADTDIDGGTLIISSINGTAFTGNPQIIPVINGVINIDMGGSIDFIPASNFFGLVTIPYSISDGNGGIATANEIIVVVSVNDGPEALDDSYVVDEDNTAAGNVITGNNGAGVDTDDDGDTLNVISAVIDINADGNADNLPLATPTDLLNLNSIPYGNIEVKGDGSFIFIPVLNFNGVIPTLTYTIGDGNGGSDSAKLNITITAVNDAPSARSFTLDGSQGEAINFVEGPGAQQLGGADPENDLLKVTERSAPLNNPSTGSIIVTTFSFGKLYSYLPNPSFCGTDSIQYKMQEKNGDLLKSAFATVTFKVNCKPTAGPIADITLDGSEQSITLTGTDSDGSIASYTITAPLPTNGVLKDSSGTPLVVGTAFTSASITYTPNSISSPDDDSFSYLVTDNLGLDSTFTNVNLIGTTVAPLSTYIKAKNPDPSQGATPDQIIGDFFGSTVSLSADGTTLAVAAEGKARVYIFILTGSGWVQQATFTNAVGGGDSFGGAMSISNDGNTLVVGARSEDSNATGVNGDQTDNSLSSAGAAYVFNRVGTSWSQQAYLKASNTGKSDRFGTSVDISGDGKTVVVGAPAEDSSATGVNGSAAAQADDSLNTAGAAYVFRFDGSNWTQDAYIKASNTGFGDSFGQSVALNGQGDSLVVAANSEDTSASGSGAIYHFIRTGSGWSQPAGLLKALDASFNDFLGNQIAMSDDGSTFVVSAPDDNSFNGTGVAYVFTRAGSSWVEISKLQASNAQVSDRFGASVAISANGNKILIGAPQEDGSSVGTLGADPSSEGSNAAGASYLFERLSVVWQQTTYIKSSNTDGAATNSSGTGDNFGSAVALSDSGNTFAVGAELEESSSPGINGDQTINGFIGAGAVYVNPHLQ